MILITVPMFRLRLRPHPSAAGGIPLPAGGPLLPAGESPSPRTGPRAGVGGCGDPCCVDPVRFTTFLCGASACFLADENFLCWNETGLDHVRKGSERVYSGKCSKTAALTGRLEHSSTRLKNHAKIFRILSLVVGLQIEFVKSNGCSWIASDRLVGRETQAARGHAASVPRGGLPHLPRRRHRSARGSAPLARSPSAASAGTSAARVSLPRPQILLEPVCAQWIDHRKHHCFRFGVSHDFRTRVCCRMRNFSSWLGRCWIPPPVCRLEGEHKSLNTRSQFTPPPLDLGQGRMQEQRLHGGKSQL